jgi:hypothetical protein
MTRLSFIFCLMILPMISCHGDERETLETIRDAYAREQQIYADKAAAHRSALVQLKQQVDFEAPVSEMQKAAIDNTKTLPKGITQRFKQNVFESAKTAIDMVSNFVKATDAQLNLGSMIIDESVIRAKIAKTEVAISQAQNNSKIAESVAKEAQSALDKLPDMATTPRQFAWVQDSLGKVAEAQNRQNAREAEVSKRNSRSGGRGGEGVDNTGRPGPSKGNGSGQGHVEGGGDDELHIETHPAP